MIKRFITSVWSALIGCIDRGEILPEGSHPREKRYYQRLYVDDHNLVGIRRFTAVFDRVDDLWGNAYGSPMWWVAPKVEDPKHLKENGDEYDGWFFSIPFESEGTCYEEDDQ